MSIIIAFITSLLGSFLAIFVALWIERQRRPNLRITAPSRASDVVTYVPPLSHAGETWKFTRALVENIEFSEPFEWIPRYTAENCWAQIEFQDINSERRFTMKGRWASTPELPHLPQESWSLKTALSRSRHDYGGF